jgi:hypothetical protein
MAPLFLRQLGLWALTVCIPFFWGIHLLCATAQGYPCLRLNSMKPILRGQAVGQLEAPHSVRAGHSPDAVGGSERPGASGSERQQLAN